MQENSSAVFWLGKTPSFVIEQVLMYSKYKRDHLKYMHFWVMQSVLLSICIQNTKTLQSTDNAVSKVFKI